MKKRMMLITVLAMVALLVFTACNTTDNDKNNNMNNDMEKNEMNDTKHNNDMESDDMESDDMESDDMESDDMESDDMESDDMEKDDMESDDMEKDDMEKDDMEKDDMESDDMEKDDMDKEDTSSTEKMMTNDGKMAKNFELKDLEGNTVSLDNLMGEKVYVKFWASWCSICVAGLEEIDEFAGMDHDFKVITIVSPDYNGEKSLSKFKSWYMKQDMENLTVLIDEDGDIARAYGVRAYPTSAFIGSDGVLVQIFPGHLDSDVITDQFDKIH